MRSKMCEMFGIDVPIFAFSHCRDVVAEVSRAGGMGILGMARMNPERVEAELAELADPGLVVPVELERRRPLAVGAPLRALVDARARVHAVGEAAVQRAQVAGDARR